MMHSKLTLAQWIEAVRLFATTTNISGLSLASSLDIQYKTGRRLAHCINRAFLKGWFCDHSFFEAKANERGATLLETIRSVIPSHIEPQLRSDITQDVAVAVLMGDLPNNPDRAAVKRYISAAFKEFADKFSSISIDQPIGSSDDERFTVGRAMGIY